MKPLLLLLVLGVGPLGAEAVWTLRTGPDRAASIPLDPVQPVPAWKGLYGDGSETVWVYATRSLYFFPPRSADVIAVPATPWTVVMFFPDAWKASQRLGWLQIWVTGFHALASLPDPGAPIVFPAVLRKN